MSDFTFNSVILRSTAGEQQIWNRDNLSACPLTIREERVVSGGIIRVDLGTAKAPFALSGDAGILLRPAIADTGEFLAIQNHSDFWCRPFWGDSLSQLPARTQELILKQGEKYLCILPLCDSVYKTLIRGCEDGVEFFLYTGCDGLTECCNQLAFVYMTGEDPLTLMQDTAALAAKALGGLKMRKDRKVSPVFDTLGWCSWDALQFHVSHDGLLEKADEFAKKQVPVGFAIIDDMWADVPSLADIPLDATYGEMVKGMHASKLLEFRGDPKRFPKGMSGAISALKSAGIPQVGIWFPTTGYWNGLDPEGSTAKELADAVVVNHKGQIIPSPKEKQAKAYFKTLCGLVSEWGGDFVKIDNQGFHKRYRNMLPIGESSRSIQRAIDEASSEAFDGALINCMGMPSECMFNRPDSAISRCSDDFMPESREWFAKNILQCSYNGLLQGQFYVNDWDMWWTDDEQAGKNSLCRAISGGPIYVSDKIGRTCPEILQPIVLQDGRILRCDDSATPTADCLLSDPTRTGKIFKIRNRADTCGLIAVFNIDSQNHTVCGQISPAEAGLKGGEYVWYEYFSGTCGILAENEKLDITLSDNDSFALYSFIPYNRGGVTVIGRTDLFVGVKAAEHPTNGGRVKLAEAGKIGLVASVEPTVLENGAPLTVTKRGNLYEVTTSTCEIDIR